MFLVFFPVNGVEEQVINHPIDAFSSFDTNMEDEAKNVMRILISQFGLENLHIYNTSENRPTTRFMSIGDFVNDLNSQELAIDDALWCIDLNLTEEQMREVVENYTSDFVILDGGTLPTCFSNGEMVVYGDYDNMLVDFNVGDKILSLVTNYDSEGKNGVVHVFRVLYDSYDPIGEFPINSNYGCNALDWKDEVYPKLCGLLKK
jgi:hypothetical protein